jgi:hypothetical protein
MSDAVLDAVPWEPQSGPRPGCILDVIVIVRRDTAPRGTSTAAEVEWTAAPTAAHPEQARSSSGVTTMYYI